MEDEDGYQCDYDYFETPRHYSENVPTSSFDKLEDFGESPCDSFPGLPFGGPSESAMGVFDPAESIMELFKAGAIGQSGLRPHWPPESGQPAALRDRSSQFGEPWTSRSSGPVRNALSSHVLTHRPQREDLMQRGALDNSLVQGGNGGFREGTPRNSKVLLKPGGIRLRQVSELPDMCRAMFKFEAFNAMQSSCFDTIMNSGENVVVSAPTGSGKTVLFELSIAQMLLNLSGHDATGKCVYVAPTKAQCSERTRDWADRFGSLGVRCCELTGDTVQPGRDIWRELKGADIIITTVTVYHETDLNAACDNTEQAEKWNNLTTNWSSRSQLLSQINLFLIDEVHVYRESRKNVLEVVVNRMKMCCSGVRFVVVSGTVRDITDVAHWIASRYSNGASATLQFGEEHRPCQLSRFVYGFPRGWSQNDFSFAQSLDCQLFPLLQEHSANRPILIFVSTRKGVFSTAEQLLRDYNKALENKDTLPWSLPKRIEKTFQHRQLEKLAAAGIGAHHAGLDHLDKRAVEELYMNGILRVVVATSALAVGVNLPSHIVVIKDVRAFRGGISQEYSDLEIMQMAGRAGRPQFGILTLDIVSPLLNKVGLDKEGVTIIMCEERLRSKYCSLGHDLNSEIDLGTNKNMEMAKECQPLMFHRFTQNPHVSKEQPWEDRREKISKCIETQRQEMELDELERLLDESFWDAVPSDDEGADVSKDRRTVAFSGGLVTDKQAEESYLPRPEKLPNGKYRCKHPCKDKSVCGHLCCRDGAKRPSQRNASAGSQPGMRSSVKKKMRRVMVDDFPAVPGLY